MALDRTWYNTLVDDTGVNDGTIWDKAAVDALMDDVDAEIARLDADIAGAGGGAPAAHKTSHQSGGSDAIKLDDLAAPDDNTDLNVSTSAHGLTPKLPNDATKYLNGTGGYTVPAGGGSSKVVQIVTATYDTQTDSSSASAADTGLTATITPTSSSNKVLVLVVQAGCAKVTNDAQLDISLYRGATNLARVEGFAGATGSSATHYFGASAINYLDSPATTSATTYKTRFLSVSGNATVRVQGTSAVSSIVLMEVTP